MSNLSDKYFHLKARMCISIGCCCANCPLSRHIKSRLIKCNTLEREEPDKALRIVKKWGEENEYII